MQKVGAQDCVPRLINGLLDDYDPSFGLGWMTCNVYDTAWVACVKKTVSGRSQWLFPSSVSYILKSQLSSGGWPAHPGEEGEGDSDGVDGILSTMAALYCLIQHVKSPLQLRHLHEGGLTERLNKATSRLREMLDRWRVDRCKAVGFEVLVPSLLELLLAEGIRFDFPGRTLLLQMRDKKFSKVQPEILYRNAPMALLHSLEAFHGLFQRYLKRACGTKTPHAGLRPKILKFLGKTREHREALVGFAPGIEPDLDDSSKASIILSLLGEPGITSRMIDYFDSQNCLKTYKAERNPSVSANCNALLAILLDSEESPSKTRTIEKVTAYICESWSNANGALNDKWNLSGYYPAMLMSRAFVELLKTWDSTRFSQLSRKLLCEKVMPVLLQCLVRTLHSQQLNGSWGREGPREETAYAILTLSTLRTLPLAQYFRSEIVSAVDRGRSFLKTSDQHGLKYLWIEKVSYTSSHLTEVYINAALYTSMTEPSLGERTRNLCSAHDEDFAGFSSRIDGSSLSKPPRWLVLASWIDSRLYVSPLQKSLGDNGNHPLKEYGEEMAFRCVFSNHKLGSVLSPRLICDMIDPMILSKHLVAMSDNAVLLLDRNWMGTRQNDPEGGKEPLQIQRNESHKMVTGEVTTNGTSKLNADYHVPELEKEDRWYSRSKNDDVKDKGSWPTSQFIVSRLLGFLHGGTTVAEAGRCARAAAQSELDRFWHAQVARMDKYERECPPKLDTYQPKQRRLEGTFSSDTVTWRLVLAFAMFLAVHEKAGRCWTAPQERLLQGVCDSIPEILRLEHELTRLSSCYNVPKDRGCKDDVVELLSYERDQLDLAMRHMKKIGVDEDVVSVVEVISDVADQTAEDFQYGRR